MKKYLLSMLIAIAGCTMALGAEPDMLVTQSGEIFKVYNLDISTADKIYYTLEDNEDAPLLKINKSDVLVIKKANGDIVDFRQTTDTSNTEFEQNNLIKSNSYTPVTFYAIEDSFLEEDVDWEREFKGYEFYRLFHTVPEIKTTASPEKFILAGNNDEQPLNMRLLSEKDKTLAVSRPREEPELDKKGNPKTDKKGNVKMTYGKYTNSEITIPDYVIINGDKYSVIEIDPVAFIAHDYIKNVRFPETLKSIGDFAFWRCSLKKIILPESLETIGMRAFHSAGDKIFGPLYIPGSVKEIGEQAFRSLGKNLSPRNFYQGTITGLPDFISVGNCKDFGIDEEAVEAYEKRRK